MKGPKTLVLVMALVTAMAATVSAQEPAVRRPVLDMHRLYQIVGYMYHIDPDLLAAIAKVESDGNPTAVSPKGAQGLMQLMPGTAQHYRVNNPFDPVENVLGAARFLSYLRVWSAMQAPYGEVSLPEMIAAYNAGPGAVEKYGGIPPYSETQDYVRKVLWTYLLGAPPAQLKLRHPAPGIAATERRPMQPPYASPAPRHHTHAAHRMARRRRDTDRSLLDQLAEIKRERQQAQLHDTETRAALHIE